MIKVENVTYEYKNGIKAIENLNLEIQDGEFVSIIGKNGSGKSTLAKLLSGLAKPTKGEIIVNDINTKDKKEQINLRKNIGIVFQNPENQIVFNKVYDELAFGMKNVGTEDSKIEEIIERCLEEVDMLEYKNSDSYELSLGQKQRIVIAGTIAMNPKILVFDEPTTSIDSEGKEKIYEILRSLQSNGYTIIYITNIMDEILLSDRIMVLEKGRLAEQFLRKDILKNLEKLQKLGIKLPEVIKIYQNLKNKGKDVVLEDLI